MFAVILWQLNPVCSLKLELPFCFVLGQLSSKYVNTLYTE